MRKNCSLVILASGIILSTSVARCATTYVATSLHPSFSLLSFAYGVSGESQVGWDIVGGDALLWNGTAESAISLNPVGYGNSIAYDVLVANKLEAGKLLQQLMHCCGAELQRVLSTSIRTDFVWSTAFGISDGRQVGYGGFLAGNSVSHALLWHGTAESVVDLHPPQFESSVRQRR